MCNQAITKTDSHIITMMLLFTHILLIFVAIYLLSDAHSLFYYHHRFRVLNQILIYIKAINTVCLCMCMHARIKIT